MGRCKAVYVGVGRCNRSDGHDGKHFAGDEDDARSFTTEEGVLTERAAFARGELKVARDRLVKRIDAYCRGKKSVSVSSLVEAIDDLSEARDAKEEADRAVASAALRNPETSPAVGGEFKG